MGKELPPRSRELLTSVTLINVYTWKNNHVLALLLPTAGRENVLSSRFNMEKAVIMIVIIVFGRT